MVKIPVPKWLYDLTGRGCGVVLLIASVLYAIGSKGIGRILAIVFAILLIYYIYDTIGHKFSKNNSVTNHKIEEELNVNSRKLSVFVAIAKPIDAKNYLISHPELLNVKMIDTLQRLSMQVRRLGDTSTESVYLQRKKLLENCIKNGIDEAFNDLI